MVTIVVSFFFAAGAAGVAGFGAGGGVVAGVVVGGFVVGVVAGCCAKRLPIPQNAEIINKIKTYG
jgi:hypothetical protein